MEVSRPEVVQLIDRLVSGELSREAAAVWASERHIAPMGDPLVEDVLDALSLIDARHVSNGGEPLHYLYDFAEIEAMRSDLAGDETARSQRTARDRTVA